MERYAIGMDLGGTVLKGGIVGESGRLLEFSATPSGVGEGPDRVLRGLLSMADDLLGRVSRRGLEVEGIAVVTPGVVDAVFGGVVGGAENLPGWERVPFMREMHERFHLPVSAHNDVSSHVLGEHRFGAGRGKKNVIMASFGTGIGGGIIIDGSLYGGAIGYGGEIGHIAVHAGGHPCACGIRGCWEEYASLRGIRRIARRMMEEDSSGARLLRRTSGENGVEPEALFEAARGSDPLARAIVDEIGRETAIGIGALINVFNPELFIVGGGIASSGDIYLDAVRRHLADWTLPLSLAAVDLVPAALGPGAGIIGSAVLVFERINTFGG